MMLQLGRDSLKWGNSNLEGVHEKLQGVQAGPIQLYIYELYICRYPFNIFIT